MILDELVNAELYFGVHPRFPEAFHFLRRAGLPDLPPGRVEIDGRGLYAVVDGVEGRGRSGARLETHRRYIDIQVTLSGVEWIGHAVAALCRESGQGYSEERDIEFFTRRPDLWVRVPSGAFCVLFPHDAHAPLAGEGPLKKVVVKVAV